MSKNEVVIEGNQVKLKRPLQPDKLLRIKEKKIKPIKG